MANRAVNVGDMGSMARVCAMSPTWLERGAYLNQLPVGAAVELASGLADIGRHLKSQSYES